MDVPFAGSRLEADLATPRHRRTWLPAGLALAAMALLYALTIPVNHTDAEDCLWYAYDVREKPYHALFDLHHLLYLPAMHLIYTTVRFVDAYHLLIGVDILCAVATVGILFFWLDRGLQLSRPASFFACVFLAFCYGFWRYADEVEVYLPALVPMALLAQRVFRRARPPLPSETWPGRVLTALLGAAAMLMHAPLSLPLAVVAVPFYLLILRRWQTLLVYGAVATVLVTGAYYTAFRMELAAHDPDLPPVPATFGKFLGHASQGDWDPEVAWSDVPKSLVGLGADVVASNYLFNIPRTSEKLAATFPDRNFSREMYTAHSYGRGRAYFGLALTVVLLGLLGFAAVARLDWSPPRLRQLFALPETLAVAVWLGTYFVLIGILEPENPENWVCYLLPLAAAAALLMHYLYRAPEHAWLPWIFAGLLLMHNLVSGFLILRRPESDLFRHQATWILSHARAGDVVFTRDNDVFSRYLRYYSPTHVVNVWQSDGEQTRAILQNTTAAPGGSRYLFMDVLNPPAYMRTRHPEVNNKLADLRQDLLPVLTPTGAEDVKRLP